MGTGIWGTGDMEHMGNGHIDYECTRGNGVQGYGVHGQWDTWAMWHRGQWGTGVWELEVWVTGDMGHMGNGHIDYECTRGNGVQGYGVHGQWDTWAMWHRGQWGTGVWEPEVWVTGGMGNMGNGAHKQWRHRAMGYRVCGVQGVWGRWAMEYMCSGGIGLQGYLSMVYREYGVHGQWDTWVMWTGTMGYRGYGYRDMGYRGYGAHGQWAYRL